jgi:CBS domain-containing protein
MTIEELCQRRFPSVAPHQPIIDAARVMRDDGVSAIVVVDNGHPVGILTNRDIVVRAVLEGRDLATTPVHLVMSRTLLCARDNHRLDELIRAMRGANVRRMPVVDANGAAVGLATLDDLFALLESGV